MNWLFGISAKGIHRFSRTFLKIASFSGKLNADENRRFSGSFSERPAPRARSGQVADGPKCEKIVVQSELNTDKHQFTEFWIGRINISKCIFQSALKSGGKKNDAYLMYENRNFQTTLTNGRKNDAYYRSRGVLLKVDIDRMKIEESAGI